MDPKKSDECCSILGVLPSVANKVGQIASELLRVDEDPKERKRERERARFTSMSEERRNELNKRRELYQRKKGDATLSDIILYNNDYGFSSFFAVGKNTVGSCTEVMDPRLHRNQRDRARPASMPSNKREEINRKRREYYQRKKEQPMLAEPNNGGKPSRNKENEDPTNYEFILVE